VFVLTSILAGRHVLKAQSTRASAPGAGLGNEWGQQYIKSKVRASDARQVTRCCIQER
jgi:hypothetical protein